MSDYFLDYTLSWESLLRLAVFIDPPFNRKAKYFSILAVVIGGLGGVQQLLGCLGYETLTPSAFSHAKTKPGYVNGNFTFAFVRVKHNKRKNVDILGIITCVVKLFVD